MAELVIRGGTLVTPEGLLRADVAIEDGRIQAIGPGASRRQPKRSTLADCMCSQP